MLGDSNQAKHDHLYWEFHELGGRQAVLKDGWKLVKFQVKDSTKTSTELYHLKDDLGETKDLAERNPEKVEELERLVKQSRNQNPVFKLFLDEKN